MLPGVGISHALPCCIAPPLERLFPMVIRVETEVMLQRCLQEERDKENKVWAARKAAQAEGRAAALQAQRIQEDADALQALSQLKTGNMQPQQPGALCGLPTAISKARLAIPDAQAAGGEGKQAEAVAAAGPHRASGSVGMAAASGRHRRSASWVKRRASSFDDNSASSVIGAALGRPVAAHQKSSSHDSVLPVKLQGPERQHSRLSSAAIPGSDVIDGSQLQVGACPCLMPAAAGWYLPLLDARSCLSWLPEGAQMCHMLLQDIERWLPLIA